MFMLYVSDWKVINMACYNEGGGGWCPRYTEIIFELFFKFSEA